MTRSFARPFSSISYNTHWPGPPWPVSPLDCVGMCPGCRSKRQGFCCLKNNMHVVIWWFTHFQQLPMPPVWCPWPHFRGCIHSRADWLPSQDGTPRMLHPAAIKVFRWLRRLYWFERWFIVSSGKTTLLNVFAQEILNTFNVLRRQANDLKVFYLILKMDCQKRTTLDAGRPAFRV